MNAILTATLAAVDWSPCLAQTRAPADAVRSAVYLLILLIIIGAFVVSAFAVLINRRRAIARSAKVRKPSLMLDAWAESGRRAEPETRIFDAAGSPAPGDAPTSTGASAQTEVRNAQNWPSGQRPVVMITGAARRVGLSIATAFARAGCDLVLTYHNSVEDAKLAADALASGGIAVRLIRLNLADIDSVGAIGSLLASELPRLDVLVHNASVYMPTPLESLTPDRASEAFRVNALAPLVLTQRLAPRLAESTLEGGGSVIALGDIHAMGHPRKNHAAYAMSKAALIEMVRSLARDLAPRVRVNAVAPGVVAWPEEGPESDELMQRAYLQRVPLARPGQPEDAAEAVRWLSLEARYVTGQIIRVDGGRSIG